MEYFSVDYGLVTDYDPITENGQLFLSEYVILRDYYNLDANPECDQLFFSQLERSLVEKGLYHRNPFLVDRRVISHDNLIGILSWSKFRNTFHRKDIWIKMIKTLFVYDNTKGRTKQYSKYLPHSPQSIFLYGLFADSKLIYVLYPVLYPYYWVNLILGCNKPNNDVSGKILDFISLYVLKDKPLMNLCWKYYEGSMKKTYGSDYVKHLMEIYHGSVNSDEQPIVKLIRSV